MESGSSRVSAVILAAGMSKRMQEPKQLLPLGKSTLLEHVMETVRSSRIGECIVVLGYAADAITERIPLNDVKVVINEAYAEGMSSSIRIGLRNVSPQAEASLVVLADQPFVKTATLDRLIDAYEESKPQVVVPIYKGF